MSRYGAYAFYDWSSTLYRAGWLRQTLDPRYAGKEQMEFYTDEAAAALALLKRELCPDARPGFPSECVKLPTIPAVSISGTRVLLVLDVSSSMAGEKIEQAKEAAVSAIRRLPPGSEVGVLTFGGSCSDGAHLLMPFSSDLQRAEVLIRGVTASGYTPLGDALVLALGILSTEGASSMVLLSDGEETCGTPENALMELAERIGTSLRTVGR